MLHDDVVVTAVVFGYSRAGMRTLRAACLAVALAAGAAFPTGVALAQPKPPAPKKAPAPAPSAKPPAKPDNKPPPKKEEDDNTLIIVLAIVGGVVILGGGGLIVWKLVSGGGGSGKGDGRPPAERMADEVGPGTPDRVHELCDPFTVLCYAPDGPGPTAPPEAGEVRGEHGVAAGQTLEDRLDVLHGPAPAVENDDRRTGSNFLVPGGDPTHL